MKAFTPKKPTKAPTPAKTIPPLRATPMPTILPATPKDPPKAAPKAPPPIAPILSLVVTTLVAFPIGVFFNSSSFLIASCFIARASASSLCRSASSRSIVFFLSLSALNAEIIKIIRIIIIIEGLNNADQNDIILVSDVDEIPNLEKINFKKISEKLILFNQGMFYYKFNLKLPNFIWTGTKACKKKNLFSPQWLRNIKDKKYPFYRIDTLFSKTKYTNIKFIIEGGWHFTNIKTAEEIRNKLKSYLHHREFDVDPISVEDINKIINNKIAIYDLNVDKRSNKFGNGKKLENYEINSLPKYLQNNSEKYKEWID